MLYTWLYVLCKSAHEAYDECEARKVFDTKVSIVLFNAFSCDQPNTRVVCHKMGESSYHIPPPPPTHKCDRCPCATAENSQSQSQSEARQGECVVRQVCHCHTRRFGTTTTNSMQILWVNCGRHDRLCIPWNRGLYDGKSGRD